LRKFCRTMALFAIGLICIPSATLFVRAASAGGVPTDDSQPKKHKPKKRKNPNRNKNKFLKGHHGKHKGRPA
jgi:hypothetical protein